MKVFLAGRVALEADGAVIPEERLPGRQGRLLLAYLVSEHGRAVPHDELAEALWGETPPATWEKALSVLVSKVRVLLSNGNGDSARLTGAFGCYRLDLPEGSWVDVIAAAAAAQHAEEALARGDLERAKCDGAVAESLVRKPFLPGDDGPWVEEKRRDLGEIRARAVTVLADACLQTGEAGEAAKWAEQLVTLEPFRDSGYRRLMQAHAAAGNGAEALRVYERCRRLLADELGAYPSAETEANYRALLEAPVGDAPAAPSDAAVPRRRRRAKVAALAVAVAIAVAAAVAVVFETRGTRSTAIAANAVGLLDAHGGVRKQIAVGGTPTSIAYGAGSVWVTDASANAVSRIDPRTGSVRDTISVGRTPSGIGVGGGGVWIANHDDGTVSWINPQSDTVVGQIHVGHGATAVAYGFGSVWVTDSTDEDVVRIAPATGDVVERIPTHAVGRGIAVGAGSVWISDEATRTLVRVDPTTNRVTGTATVGSGPAGIVYGGGVVWVANDLDGTVSEVDPATMDGRAVIPVGGSPSALAFWDGAVWVGAEFERRVVKIDAKTHAQSVVRVENRPEGLASAPGGVWVAVQPSGSGHYGGRLVVVDDAGFDSIDPALTDSTTSFTVVGLAYDGLTSFRRVGGSAGTQLVPDLAASLPAPIDGGRSYTFKLRAHIRYSDGTLVRPEDFRRAFERLATLRSPLLDSSSALSKIVGAAHCVAGGGRPCDLSSGVVAGDAGALTFRLTAPDARFPLALSAVSPIPPGTPPHDVGRRPIPATGPYQVRSYVPGKALTLVRNRYFHSWSQAARPNGYPDEIVWRVYRRIDLAVRDVLAGKADVLTQGVPPKAVARLAATYPRQLHFVPQLATSFVFLNTRLRPFDDVRVRRAINYAVDRREVAALYGGAAVAQPTCQILPPPLIGFRRYCPYTADAGASGEWKAPDVAKARALIAASGTRGERVVVWTFPHFHREAVYLVALLRRLGYRARLHEVPLLETYFAEVTRAHDVQAGFAGWFGTLLPSDMFGALGCRFTSNLGHFCDPRVDAQVRRLVRTEATDPAGGAALASRIDRELVDEAAWVPLFTPRFADLVSRRVGNYQANPYDSASVLLDQLWVR